MKTGMRGDGQMEIVGICALILFFTVLSIVVEFAPVLIAGALMVIAARIIAQIFTRS